MPYEDLYKEQYCPQYYDEYWEDPSQYIPRVEGTELKLGITILDFNYLPILTCRNDGRKVKYYLFDFIKIWQTVE